MPPPHRRAFAALVPTLVLLAAPAVAQEVQTAPPVQTVAPPPVVPTITAAPPAPVAATPPVAQATAPEPVAVEPAAETEAAPVTRRTTRAVRQTRTVTRTPAPQRAAPVAAAPAPAAVAVPATTPPVTTPEVTPVAEAPVVAAAPAPAPEAAVPVADTANATTTTTTEVAPVWPWVVAGLAVLALLGALLLRRRRRAAEDVYYEEEYVEPVAEAAPARIEPARAGPVMSPEPQFVRVAPLAATPVAAATADKVADAVTVEAELAEPEAEDVAALTAGSAHADRPWLEFSMRPVRAGSNADDALVEIELTVGNSGAIAAEDVRISTFMFATEFGNEAEMERLLLDRTGEGEVSPVTIKPGEGTRVDATLSLSKEVLGEEAKSFVPFVVANARYRLADGSEGHTSASFTIGMNDDGTNDGSGEMRPIAIHRQQMSDNIEARLHGVPEHA
ncbi:hypothetical protein [Sphingomonas sp. ERG5]|uniref:hypothetical protein n=1 Tax=Sphingomonas sp. ERG5 TaxID=1381597 RepID=UPI001F22857F|nr:hypothetical protein [Sphingomonas sp. ERG5]